MKSSALFFVWVYLVAATFVEVSVAYSIPFSPLVLLALGILSTSQGISIMLFYMHLKNEPPSIKLFAILPLMFLAALIVAMIASLG